MPQVVEANRGEASAPEERLEVTVDYILGLQGVPTCVVKTRPKRRKALRRCEIVHHNAVSRALVGCKTRIYVIRT